MATSFVGWRREGQLPYLSGGFSVGCIELEFPAPTAVGACSAICFYPSTDDASCGERPPWLSDEQLEEMGRAELSPFFGEAASVFFMRSLGGVATGLLRLPATRGLSPAALPESFRLEGWPVAVLSHGLSGWATESAGLAASLCSHGCVVLLLDHCDSACHCDDYEEWRQAMLAHGIGESALAADGEVWRRSQNEQRIAEVHAALDHLNAQIKRADERRFALFRARTGRGVALVGHSFGGATAAACVLRDGESKAPRFSHCFVSDPWIGGVASPLSEAELAGRPLAAGLKTMRVWLNEGSPNVMKSYLAAAETLVHCSKLAGAKSAELIRVPAEPDAQIDTPTVLSSGPFACLWAVARGAADRADGIAGMRPDAVPARAALRSCIVETLEPLLEQGWLAVGLAPLGP
jgi:pimeloyl-ACP methyl ester carboxylesterase